jgi:hypothetical protein
MRKVKKEIATAKIADLSGFYQGHRAASALGSRKQGTSARVTQKKEGRRSVDINQLGRNYENRTTA